jgi:hypothetical protein
MPSDKRLPAKDLHLTLPELTVEQAAELLSLIDDLYCRLWDTYGHEVVQLYGDPRPDDEPYLPEPADDDLPF